MSSDVNSINQKMYMANFWTEAARSFWGASKEDKSSNTLLDFLSEEQSLKVDMCLSGVGRKVTEDMAAVTAHYLVDHPELHEEYALVVINDPLGGWEARAYRRSDLTAGLEGEELETALEMLDRSPLLYHTSTSGLPDVSEDPELTGLAEKVQAFLDKNEKVLNILVRDGYLEWAAEA